MATANDVTQLPPELLRKGRFDELWFVDLPNRDEREAIWNIQIEKRGRRAGDYDVGGVSTASEGFTGAEIEQAFVDAMYMAFSEGREPQTTDVLRAMADPVPLSRLMSEQMAGLRKWATGRCRKATSQPREPKGRKIAA